MIKRLLKPLKSNSFFLFGARGTGKTTYLKEELLSKDSVYIDLLSASEYSKFRSDPDILIRDKSLLKESTDWCVIDEIQKVPALLDVVHLAIESKGVKFALTGSSARKLRRGLLIFWRVGPFSIIFILLVFLS